MINLDIREGEVYFDSKEVEEVLTFLHPDRFMSPSFESGFWDGKVRLFSPTKKRFSFNLLPYVIGKLDRRELAYSLTGDLSIPEPIIVPDSMIGDKFKVEGREYQISSIKTFLEMQSGVLKIPTRAGKTFVASEILRILLNLNALSGNFLFLAENTAILRQNSAEILDFIGRNEKDGDVFKLIGRESPLEDKLNPRFGFSMFKTLDLRLKNTKKYKEESKVLQKFLKNVDFLVVDEIHKFASDTKLALLKKVIKLSSPKFRLFLSATPWPKEIIQKLKLMEVTGPIFFEVKTKNLQGSVLAEDKILMLKTNARYPGNYIKQLDRMKECRRKNLAFKLIIEYARKHKITTLVFFDFVEHGRGLCDENNMPFISGSSPNSTRERVRLDLINKKVTCAGVTRIWQEGITLPEVQLYIYMGSASNGNNALQRRGRVLGATKGKTKSLTIDFWDKGKNLSDASLSRFIAYKNETKDIEVIDVENNLLNKLKEHLTWLQS